MRFYLHNFTQLFTVIIGKMSSHLTPEWPIFTHFTFFTLHLFRAFSSFHSLHLLALPHFPTAWVNTARRDCMHTPECVPVLCNNWESCPVVTGAPANTCRSNSELRLPLHLVLAHLFKWCASWDSLFLILSRISAPCLLNGLLLREHLAQVNKVPLRLQPSRKESVHLQLKPVRHTHSLCALMR